MVVQTCGRDSGNLLAAPLLHAVEECSSGPGWVD